MYTGGIPPKMPARTQPTPNQPSTVPTGGKPMPGMGMGGMLGMTGSGNSAQNLVYGLAMKYKLTNTSSEIEKDAKQKEMSSLLWESANKNDLNGVKQAMAESGDPNVCDLQGVSALLLAVKNKNPTVSFLF
jgi:hypothetical protein